MMSGTRSIRRKIFLLVLTVNLCSLCVLGGALLYNDLVSSRQRAAQDLYTLAGVLGQGSAASLQFDDPKVAQESLTALRAHRNVMAAAIYSSRGGLFASYLGEGVAPQALPSRPRGDGIQAEGSELAVYKPIQIGKESLGTVYLSSRYDLSEWLRAYLLILGAVLLASLGIGLSIASRLQRRISGPIEGISALAQRVIDERNFSLRAQRVSDDETGRLALSFNGMLDALEHEIGERNAAEAALRGLNADLEQRVTERTAALRESNQSLVARTEEAEAANRAKADFLANMSHEIRTPMNAVLGLAYLLDQSELPGEANALVKKIRNSGRSLQAIINDILDFSKIEAGRLEIEKAPFQLANVFENLASIMSANAGDKDIELLIAPPPALGGQLFGDALRLEQVLVNLTGNAIKFTDRGRVAVEVSLQARDEQRVRLRFSVRDTGIGIPLAKQPLVFAAFAQADSSTTRRFGGTGLGLAICKHLVEQMGGEIGVISAPGEGSEFWFSVPFEWNPAVAVAPRSLAQLEVLVADDSEEGRHNLALTARSLGWSPAEAESGRLAIELLQTRQAGTRPFDVLVLDWKMPDMDGLAVACEARHVLGQGPAPVIVLVTAFSREVLARKHNIEAVDCVLSKPVTSSMLYNSVAAVLERRGGMVKTAAAPARDQLQGVRVLVVDDSEINREVAQRILQRHGATVELAEDGQAALDWLDAHPKDVDLVLMDVQMPVMDGYEATRQLRARPTLAHLPVVALTAGAFKVQQEQARQAGMDAFVSKPIDVEVLLKVIERLRHPEVDAPPKVELPEAAAPGDLPGLAIARGLALWQEPEVYARYLRKFWQAHQGVPAQLVQLLERQDLTAVRALAHRIKGGAANLALLGLAQAAERVEGAMGDELGLMDDIRGLEGALAELGPSLARYTESVLGPERVSAPETGPASAVSAAQARPLLTELLQVLEDDSPDRAEPLLAALEDLLPPARVAGLRQCLEDFDFRAARARVQDLCQALQPEPVTP